MKFFYYDDSKVNLSLLQNFELICFAGKKCGIVFASFLKIHFREKIAKFRDKVYEICKKIFAKFAFFRECILFLELNLYSSLTEVSTENNNHSNFYPVMGSSDSFQVFLHDTYNTIYSIYVVFLYLSFKFTLSTKKCKT